LNCLGIKHFVFTTASKIDPVEKHWKLTDVELRNPKEIWVQKNKNINKLISKKMIYYAGSHLKILTTTFFQNLFFHIF
jgi:methylthioribose-1-phosphate isomerase